MRIPKDVFVNGQNQVELNVFGNGGARIDKTITLQVQKGIQDSIFLFFNHTANYYVDVTVIFRY